MKKQEVLKVKRLSVFVGNFIRYWGFRKIHGEIWTLVYLSKKPMSGIEIRQVLNVSKALISPALKELEHEGLIKQAKSENLKTKRYEAEEDVTKIIHGVLKRREKPMIDKISQCHIELRQECSESDSLDEVRIERMGLMIEMARLGLASLLDADQIWDSFIL